jgi:signal transduction histidine kinase
MSPEPESAELPQGRLLLDGDAHVREADAAALEALGMPAGAGEAALKALQHGLAASRLLPGEGEPEAFFRTAVIPGVPPRMVEAAFCREPSGGWTVALRQLAERRGWLGGEGDQARFLANFSHELRTPLTTLKTSLALIDRSAEALPEKARGLLSASRRNVDRLIHLVAELMDITAISSGQLELKLKDEDPGELIGAAVQRIRDRTGREDLAETLPSEPLPPVRADRARVLRVLEELLDNAVKCSEAGSGIVASAEVAGADVRFAVRDHGPGLPEEQHEAVFRPFHQVDMSLTRGVAGLGLGLAICKGIVEEHGGRIRIDSSPDGGCTFSFTLHLGGGD